jgi:hypothetical protein
MNGQDVSATIEKVDELLNKFQATLGIKELGYKNADLAEKYLQATPEEIRKMSVDDCIEASIVLSQFAWFLQRTWNEENTHVNWSTAKLNRFVAAEGMKYKAPSADERRYLCIINNEFGDKLE